ncbi:MAG TPA: tetratricopeptide repeat protein, partial [Bacteroidia bacterium]|nr:tetratricopeptide repeat protein [Bacteroidia bacterium]
MKKFRSYHFAFLLLTMAFIVACSTTKNTFVTRSYHNMTSRYNGYFYAKEAMKSAMLTVDKSYVDDYSQLLPLFKLPITPETKACYTDLEKAIKKSQNVISRHTITNKSGIEIPGAVKWIDDNYLIIGQAHYYKGEYLAALDMFDYIIDTYSKFPIRFDGMLWKARAQIQLGAYKDAESELDVVANNKSCPPRLNADVKATYADLYMHTGNYPNAIKYLEQAILLTKKKSTRARYLFVLAQLYEKVGKEKDAYATYGKVIALHPQYDMLFNAKLNRARLSASDVKNRTAAKKELQKMLTDEKNIEFQDQIYYTLGQLEEKSGDKAGALAYYKLSVAASVGNSRQKAVSYLAIGDLYLADTDYKGAGAYYDSTLQFLPRDYPDYDGVADKRKSLDDLVRFLDIISNEDSLQNIVNRYGSDTTALYPFIDGLIAKQKEEDDRKKELQSQQNQSGVGNNNNLANQNNLGSGAAWYFYNPSTVSFGINEFTRKWGSRKLEDNWRRSNKEVVVEDNDNSDNPSDSGSVVKGGSAKAGKNDKYSRDYYIKNLPLTADAKAKSDDRIADAYFNLGSIYKEQMGNTPKAIDAFETLCKRFPDHKYAMPAHYQLYRMYKAQKNSTKAQEHKDYICSHSPDGEYCRMINDSSFFIKREGKREKMLAFYDSTFITYSHKNYPAVVSMCNQADSLYGTDLKTNEMAAKFAYMRAASLGKTQGIPAMEAALTKILVNYPKDPIIPQVQSLLDAIREQRRDSTGNASNPKKDTSGVKPPAGPDYKFNEKVEYQYMVVVQPGKGDLNNFKIAISDFNSQMFSSNNLEISTLVLDASHTLIMVQKFPDKSKAMEYYDLLKSRPDIFAWLNQGSYQAMVISTENLPLLLKDKNVDTYKTFFQQ